MNHNISGIVTPGNTKLAAMIMEIGNTNVFACYQYGNCSGGCPAADYMDLKPHLVIRLIQLGQALKVPGSNTIGADVIVVCCPLCAYNLDALQVELMHEEKIREQCSWVHKKWEIATHKAIKIIQSMDNSVHDRKDTMG